MEPGTKFWKGEWRGYTYPSDNITTPLYITYITMQVQQAHIKILGNISRDEINMGRIIPIHQ